MARPDRYRTATPPGPLARGISWKDSGTAPRVLLPDTPPTCLRLQIEQVFDILMNMIIRSKDDHIKALHPRAGIELNLTRR
jgi:hypothetical protein